MDTKKISKALRNYNVAGNALYDTLREIVKEKKEITFKKPIKWINDEIISVYYDDGKNDDAYIKTAKGVHICSVILTYDTLYNIISDISAIKFA